MTDLERMRELRAYFRWHGRGCCALCALAVAIAEVEREAGRQHPKPNLCQECRFYAEKWYPGRPKWQTKTARI